LRALAEWSGMGAGGVGSAPAGAAAGAASPWPLVQQPTSQQAWQHLLRFWKRRASRPQRFLQQGSQQASAQQFGSQQASAQQAGSQQAGSQQASAQQLGSQQAWQHCLRNIFRRAAKMSIRLRLQQGWQQGSQQASAQQAGSQQASAQQLGSQQASAQQLGSQQGSQQAVSQQLALQQPPLEPNIRFRRSKPKLWLHRPTLTTSAPTNILLFIEQRLLCLELKAARIHPVDLGPAAPGGRGSVVVSGLGEGLRGGRPNSVWRVGGSPRWDAWVGAHSSVGHCQVRRTNPWPDSRQRLPGSLTHLAGACTSLRDTYRIGCPAQHA